MVKAAHDGLNGGVIKLEVSMLFTSIRVGLSFTLVAVDVMNMWCHLLVELNCNGIWTQVKVRSGAAQRDIVSYEKRRF